MAVLLSVLSENEAYQGEVAADQQFYAVHFAGAAGALVRPMLPSSPQEPQSLYSGCNIDRGLERCISWLIKLVTKTVARSSGSILSRARTTKGFVGDLDRYPNRLKCSDIGCTGLRVNSILAGP
jgi:hypothetical protein